MLDQSKVKITVLNGRQAGNTYSLKEGDKKIIGRDNNCHIQILDKGISRNHSLLEWKSDHFLLVDLGSTNGTFVNNKIIISKILEDGDIFKIGQTELKYEALQEAKASSASFEDDILEYSPNTIMERVDVSHSLCGVSSLPRSTRTSRETESEPESPDAKSNLYLSTIYEVSNLVNAEHDLKQLFETIMDKIMQVFEPDRGFLVMQSEDGSLNVAVEKNYQGGEAKLSHTILKKTIKEGISVLSANAMLDDRFTGGMSIVSQQIKSVMSVPLESSKKILGAIYVDSLGSSNCFKKMNLDLLTAIGKQAGVAVERAMLFEHFMEKEKIQQALEIAQNIQKSLLPSSVPDDVEFDMVGWNLTCDETGGDYYDFFKLPGNKLGITIGDVTGHGVGAALLMATARAFLKALVMKSNSITNMMDELNTLLERDMEDDKFMTLFYGEIDTQKLTLRYANAGHDAPLLYRKKQDQFEELEGTGIPLGMMDDFEYEEGEVIQIQAGDILVLSTDGITESMNPQGEQFGTERLLEVIKNGANKSANQIIKDCYDRVQKFCQGTPQRDDLTLVIVKFDKKLTRSETDQEILTKKIDREYTVRRQI